MYSLPCYNKSCSQCCSSICLFRENGINEQKGQNPKINKRAGENKSKQGRIKASRGGKMLKINERACSFIRYLRVVQKDTNMQIIYQIY